MQEYGIWINRMIGAVQAQLKIPVDSVSGFVLARIINEVLKIEERKQLPLLLG